MVLKIVSAMIAGLEIPPLILNKFRIAFTPPETIKKPTY